MDRQILATILTLGLVGSLTIACQKGDQPTKIRRSGEGNVSNYRKDSDMKGVPNLEKLTEEQKEDLRDKAEIVKDLRAIHNQAHQIFSEAWKTIRSNHDDSLSSANSVFRVIEYGLKSSFNSRGFMVDPDAICKRNAVDLRVSSTREEAGVKVPFEIAVYFNHCQSQTSVPAANFRRNGNGQYQLEYQPSEMASGAGASQVLLNKTITCQASLSEHRELTKLSCVNLGQNSSMDEHYEFTEFSFEKEQQSLLSIKGNVFKNFRPAGNIEIKVPMDGDIIYNETRLLEEEALGVAEAPAPAPVVSTTTTTTLPKANPVPNPQEQAEVQGDDSQLPQNIEDSEGENRQEEQEVSDEGEAEGELSDESLPSVR